MYHIAIPDRAKLERAPQVPRPKAEPRKAELSQVYENELLLYVDGAVKAGQAELPPSHLYFRRGTRPTSGSIKATTASN